MIEQNLSPKGSFDMNDYKGEIPSPIFNELLKKQKEAEEGYLFDSPNDADFSIDSQSDSQLLDSEGDYVSSHCFS